MAILVVFKDNFVPQVKEPTKKSKEIVSLPNTFSSLITKKNTKEDYANILKINPASHHIDIANHKIKIEYNYADPSNYGDRVQSINGKVLTNKALFVLHETVISANETIKKFKTYHLKDEDQASYHILIRTDGSIVWLVPFEKRAYGAGDSAFNGESVQTNPKIKPSVNNFAYHLALETPPDGKNENFIHSGYTDSQYQSLALFISVYVKSNQLLPSRIVTHKEIDLSKTRTDPRSFDQEQFNKLLRSYTYK
ncbi:MAG TPA: peptidoglycan recognition family protein [Stenomitos sp.]